MTDQTVQVITGIIGLISTIFTGTMAYLMAKLNRTFNENQVKLDEIAQNTDGKLTEMAVVGEKIHLLVNSAMSSQLKISAVALRRIADMTKDPGDREAANLASKALEEHLRKQAIVDKSEGKV